jgi:hypothetical protein
LTTTINASTSSGLVNSADTSGILQLQTASTAALTIDASQNVGIGTASPADKLHVAISSGSLGGIRVQNTNSGGQAALSYYNDAATQKADIWWNNSGSTLNLRTLSTDPMIFYTNNSERMRVNAGAPILCLSGGSTSATGTGIAFPATQSASSDANTLDDYEEGTWTPVLKFGGATTGITYSTQNGSYIKVGKNVFITLYILLSSKGSATGIASITGLPFSNAFNPAVVGCCGFDVNYSLVANSGVYSLTDSGSAQILLRTHGASNYSDISNSNFNNNTGFYVATTYVATA